MAKTVRTVSRKTGGAAIQDLAETDHALLPLFSPTERAVIEVCKEIVEMRENE